MADDAIIDLSNINLDELDPKMRSLVEAQMARINQLEGDLEKKQVERKAREPKTLLERLQKTLESDPKGFNLHTVLLANNGDQDSGITSDDILDVFAKVLEECGGVTVDRSKLTMGDHFVQFVLRLYNSDPVRDAVAAEQAEVKAQKAEAEKAAAAAKTAA